jgi:K+-sensing histidine kinase KdpD
MVSNLVNYLSLDGILPLPGEVKYPVTLTSWPLLIGIILCGVLLALLQTKVYLHNRNMSRFKYLKENSQTLSEIEDLNELHSFTKQYLAKITRSIARHYIKSANPSDNQVGKHLIEAAHKLKKGHQLSSDDQKLLKENWSTTLSQLLLIN